MKVTQESNETKLELKGQLIIKLSDTKSINEKCIFSLNPTFHIINPFNMFKNLIFSLE